jgi:hypothetical protein
MVIKDREDFAAHHAIAREEGDFAMAHQMLDIVDNRRHDWITYFKPNGEIATMLDPHRIRRATLRVGARKMLLAKAWRAAVCGLAKARGPFRPVREGLGAMAAGGTVGKAKLAHRM